MHIQVAAGVGPLWFGFQLQVGWRELLGAALLYELLQGLWTSGSTPALLSTAASVVYAASDRLADLL